MVVKGEYFKSHGITGGFVLTETINAYEIYDIMVLDVPNAFIHTNMPPSKYGEEMIIIKITGVLVDILFEMDSDTYRKHVVFENVNKLIYIFLLRAIHVMLVAELLFYNKFRG